MYVQRYCNIIFCIKKIRLRINLHVSVLEITVGHWPFSDQFQHLADQNLFWLANFTVHFQWDGNQ